MKGSNDENIAKVIRLKDPDIPEYLDFDKLRTEGLEHIGELSGKIWTDHNLHDPGISILEVLVYALMDLGYKTNLPFQDLISSKDGQQEEDNFLTPLQILSINPVSILDYRKLLLECPGVRNAWIEPAPQNINLSIIQWNNTLNCGSTYTNRIQDCNDNSINGNIELNGLYKIYIEKNEDVEDTEELKEDVRKLWSQYRNLCEDLIDVSILDPVEFGVCAEVEIMSGVDASKVYKAILLGIRDFIQPQINYYTLKGLLDKGRSMDEVFSGRPYLTDSFGFVDTEELEALKRRKVIYLSDLYNVILSIEGVRKIKRIRIDGGTSVNQPSYVWVEGNKIEDTQIPVFSLDKTCVDIYSTEGILPIEKNKIHRNLLSYSKFKLSLNNLNAAVPSGRFYGDLSDYYSIQNDFPVVYGIGEDGLPDSASHTRQAQALQLKAYLMFYDQLLANYTSQLTNIRSLFSLKPEADRSQEEKQTYYTQIPDTIPGIEALLKFYNSDKDIPDGAELALPVANDEKWQKVLEQLQTNSRTSVTIGNYCENKNGLLELFIFSSSTVRATYVNQMLNAFTEENYEVQVLKDRGGYFFVLAPCLPNDILLIGSKRYKEFQQASNEARNVAFIASLKENYNLITAKSESISPDKHYFGLNYHPISYLELMQEIVEDNKEYSERRQRMLDHLLARFGEDFTDYALLQYKQKISKEELQQDTLNHQSSYLSQFSEISRDRGKAFDYLQESWNTANVSGFEKRVSMLSGIDNYERRHLCNVEVHPCFQIQLKDEKGNLLIKGSRSYDSVEDFSRAAGKILNQLRDPSKHEGISRIVDGFDADTAKRLFSAKASEENIIVSKFKYLQQLLNSSDEIVETNEEVKFNSPEEALEKKDEFIKNLATFHLLPIKGRQDYLDINAFDMNITKYSWWKWKLKNPDSEEVSKSEKSFSSQEEAWKHLIENSDLSLYITEFEGATSWDVFVNDVVTLTSSRLYVDRAMSQAAWEDVKELAQKVENYSFEKINESSFKILLHNEKQIIAVSQEVDLEVFDPEASIKVCAKAFLEENLKPEITNLYQVYGFKIPGENSFPSLESFHRYASQKEALEDLRQAYDLGTSKRNYAQFGEEEDDEFGFVLELAPNLILAYPTSRYITEKDRTRALNAGIRFFKKYKAPVSLQKQANQYTWSIAQKFKGLIRSEEEFTSSAKAKADFEKALLARAAQVDNEVFKPHFYHVSIKTVPVSYKFLYGNTSNDKEFTPLFISEGYFLSIDTAKKGYSDFVKQLPELSFIASEEEGVGFELYENSEEKPIAVQYQKDSYKASSEEAKTVVEYLQAVYNNPNAESSYITQEMMVDRRDLFGWKFYKKNDPLAVNPYRCSEKSTAEEIGSRICDKVPPIDLNHCPPKEIVVCLKNDHNKYHYRICFSDKNGLEFILLSYVGYNSYEEAFEAWEREWYEVILLAKSPSEYEDSGKISLDEIYKPIDDNSCDDTSFIAVVPEENKLKLIEAGEDVVKFYTNMAHLFPIYEIKKEDETRYKFKVVVKDKNLGNSSCDLMNAEVEEEDFGSLIWLGTHDYSCYAEAIKAYNHFYILAGTSQNCRILCEHGRFYVALIEVLVESLCKYTSAAEAWDDAFASIDVNGVPSGRDACGDCPPGGVRSFFYASDDPKNYIPVCVEEAWTFKVVAAEYFVATHTCNYNSEKERDKALEKWESNLKKLRWEDYLKFEDTNVESEIPNASLYSDLFGVNSYSEENNLERICDLVFTIRKCLEDCSKSLSNADLVSILRKCLLNKYSENIIYDLLRNLEENIDEILRFVAYFPIYASEDGHCYRIYWPENDKDIFENGLPACGCEETPIEEASDTDCTSKYPIISSKCFSCCGEALRAFEALCQLFKDDKYTIECTQSSEYGPYSFEIVDTSKELGYHPQSYKSYQEVLDAIEVTLNTANDIGMHLLEHILLRPKTDADCEKLSGNNQDERSCLLPICPDYCCPINWYPDMDKDDPCAGDDPEVIHYLPGSDPYSFWATLALPSWAKRFRTKESRNIFEQLLYKEVPALVGLNILWLGPRDMCLFEDKFRRWLDWLLDPENICDADEKHLSCQIAECIEELESEKPCPTIPGVDGSCNCGIDDNENMGSLCLPQKAEDSIFWGYCAPQIYEPEPNTPTISHVVSRIEASESENQAELLTRIRQRKPAYLANIENTDDSIKQTKSYERAVFFLNNTPSIDSYVKLVNYFNRYSLKGSENESEYLKLLQNATGHLLDKLVLDDSASIPKKELEKLQESIALLKEKGLTHKKLDKSWNSKALGTLANTKPLGQIKKLLNGK